MDLDKKNRIRKSNKIRERTVKDKAHHATLKRVQMQRMSINALESSREHRVTLEPVFIQIMNIQAEEASGAHHGTL